MVMVAGGTTILLCCVDKSTMELSAHEKKVEVQRSATVPSSTMFSDESVYSFDSIRATYEDNFTALESFLEQQQRESEKTPIGSESTWNKEAKSEAEVLGLNLYDSLIVALKDGANKMDAVFTADHVGTLNEEIQRLKRALVDKSQQVCELQSLVQIKDDRISTLELERDLYKADTKKLSNDVRALVVKVKEIEASSQDTISTRTPVSDLFFRSKLNARANESTPDTTEPSINNSLILLDSGPSPEVPSELEPMITISEKYVFSSKPPRERSKHTGFGGRAIQFCRHMKRHGHVLPKNSTERSSEEDSEPDSLFSEQLQELRHRLKTAITTSDELRLRLAMVSRYYEGALASLSINKDTALTNLQSRVRDLEDKLVSSTPRLER